MVNKNINKINYTYIDAVVEASGVPVVIPILKDIEDIEIYLDIVDGIIFTGGEDISSLYFDEEPIREVDDIYHDRDITEMELFEKAYTKGIPVLGICRGAQLINIGLGGNIYQDIYKQLPNTIGHYCPKNLQDGYHSIKISNDSILFEIFKSEKLVVNSWHHQGIKDIGRYLKVTSTSSDGIVEAIESTNKKFVLGLQFHPEEMAVKYKEFLKPYSYFISKCKK